uniref:Uncharacterized protein n=1 Tax=Acrobeloides nanus TaxID=290746 RepID=A0A914DS45_9BILA
MKSVLLVLLTSYALAEVHGISLTNTLNKNANAIKMLRNILPTPNNNGTDFCNMFAEVLNNTIFNINNPNTSQFWIAVSKAFAPISSSSSNGTDGCNMFAEALNNTIFNGNSQYAPQFWIAVSKAFVPAYSASFFDNMIRANSIF